MPSRDNRSGLSESSQAILCATTNFRTVNSVGQRLLFASRLDPDPNLPLTAISWA
jgi:hypothetical protein